MSETSYEDRISTVSASDPYDPGRLWGDEKYRLQNMLIRQVNMPRQAKLKFLGDAWSDRLYEACNRAYEEVVKESSCSPGGGDACNWFRGCSDQEFLSYAQILSDAGWRENPPKVVGARMVRHTNVASGYPVYQWTFLYEHNNDPSVQGTAPINIPEPQMDLMGRTWDPMLGRMGCYGEEWW